jgi:hypothetical protein
MLNKLWVLMQNFAAWLTLKFVLLKRVILMQRVTTGDLYVVGPGEVAILLEKKTHEKHIQVEFIDSDVSTCNPHTEAELSWEMQQSQDPRHHRGYLLKIRWTVSGARTIRWTAKY